MAAGFDPEGIIGMDTAVTDSYRGELLDPVLLRIKPLGVEVQHPISNLVMRLPQGGRGQLLPGPQAGLQGFGQNDRRGGGKKRKAMVQPA